MRRERHFYELTLFVVLVLLTTPSCASVGAQTARASSQPAPELTRDGTDSKPVEEPPGDSGTEAPESDAPAGAEDGGALGPVRPASYVDPVAQIRAQMEERYLSGLEAYLAGRFDEAKGHFDRAVDVVLSSGIERGEEPELSEAFDEMIRTIADLDVELYSREADAESRDRETPLEALRDITTFMSPKEAERERQRIEEFKEQITYDIPIDLNRQVLSLVEAFQTRLRKEFEAGLKRSGAYLPFIKRVFREEGLPEDLAYMAHQESAFKNTAYSRARAKGMWQFMSYTGRKYGLKRDLWVDERSDFEKATRAAAAYLKFLYERYGDWYLAMAAYNAGEGRIDRAIRRARTKDFWKIARTRHIRRETKNYVPAILASILIDKSPQDYGFDVEIDPELKWETVELDKPTDLHVIAELIEVPMEGVRFLNPELRGFVTPPNVSNYTVRVPVGTRETLIAKLEDLPDEKRVRWALHRVKRGDTFSGIARKYRIPLRALLDANPRYARRQRSLPRGVTLKVPLSKYTPGMLRAGLSEDRPSYQRGERVVHRVRRGETLGRIASKYRTTVANLREWNGLRGSLIRPGQRLIAYYGERRKGYRVGPGQGEAVVAEGGRRTYRVRRGDTLNRIAQRFKTTVSNLCRWNNLTTRSVIYPGDRLWVSEAPSPTGASVVASSRGTVQHRVRRGDTLYQIARRYAVTVRQVQAWNDLGRSSRIYPGQVLRIEVK